MKKKAISTIVKGIQKVAKASAKKKAAAATKKVSSGAKTTAKLKNVRSKTGLLNKETPATAAKKVAKKTPAHKPKVGVAKSPTTAAQGKANTIAFNKKQKALDSAKAAAPTKTAAKKVAKKAPVKTATKKTAAKKAPAKKAPAKKAPAKKTATKKTATKKTATKKTATKKTATKKTATKKTATKETATKKTATKKVAAKKVAKKVEPEGPIQGPANYKGSFFKNKEKALKESQAKFMNSKGSSKPKVKSKSGESARSAGYKAGKKAATGRTLKKVKKGAAKVAKSRITQGIASGAIGAKLGGGGGGSESKKTKSKYFTEAELQAARRRMQASRSR